MTVNGTMNVSVEISVDEALKVIYPALGFKPNTSDKGYVVLEKDDEITNRSH